MPYIPENHIQYDLLPSRRKRGGEVFDYPSGLINEVEQLLDSCEEIIPYNYKSYEEYFCSLDALIQVHAASPKLVAKLVKLKEAIISMNQKEEWSVLKYVGPTDDCFFGLTHGKNYYWPTEKSNPVYHGVIDNEEFTAYLYPTEASLWVILEDPTGMAYQTIYRKGKGYISQPAYNQMMKSLADCLNKPDDELQEPT